MMNVQSSARMRPTRAAARHFYRATMRALTDARVPFVVGGAFALRHYTGIHRDTKDLDVFIRPDDVERALGALTDLNVQVELTFPHWLAKAFSGNEFVDIIFNSANGLCPVDDGWFAGAPTMALFDVPIRLCPIEEVIWTKCFVMERERFDGADICHLIRARGTTIDWRRLIDRFDQHWRVLYGHLVFFSFAYPHDRDAVPPWVYDELMARFRAQFDPEDDLVCRGTLISREQYLVDVRDWGYADARLPPRGHVKESDLAVWTEAIGTGK